MRIAGRIDFDLADSIPRLLRRRPLAHTVGFFVAMTLLGACADELPTEVRKNPGQVRLNVSAAEGPRIGTDKYDYAPGETVTITGWDWELGEAVRLQVLHMGDEVLNEGPRHEPWDVTADASGGVSATWQVTEEDAGMTLRLTADGQSSGAHAEVTFTDLQGAAVMHLYTDAARTIAQTAYPWGATIYSRLTGGGAGICYRIQWFDPSGTLRQSTIFGPGSSSYNPDSYTVPATGPSGRWSVLVEENNGAINCNTASYGNGTSPIYFDVARAVVVGAGTAASDASYGDICTYQVNPPTGGCSATGTSLWVRSTSGDVARSFVHFDLSLALPGVIPAGAQIDSARVRLAVNSAGTSRTYNIHRVTTAGWVEGTVTVVGTGLAVAGAPTSSATIPAGLVPVSGTAEPQTWVSWDVAADIQSFMSGTTNHGWRISDAAEGSGSVARRFHSTESTSGPTRRAWPVLLINYSDPPKLAFYTTAKTGVVGACLGPIQIQSKDFSGAVLPVASDVTVNLATANLGVGDVFGTAGAGSFFSDAACTTGTTSTTISTGNSVSSSFYYRATHRGDGGHDVVASATGYTPNPSQTQTINKAITVTTYDGDLIVIPGTTFTGKAVLTSTYDKCAYDGTTTPYGRRVLFVFDPDPSDGIGTLNSGFKFTNSSGVATATFATTGWIEGMYDLTINAVENDNCTAQKAVPDPVIAVLAPGNAATGGGFLAGSKVGGGRVNFGFNVRPIEGSDPVAYKGQFLLIRQDGGVPSFRCKGPLTFYGIVPSTDPIRNYATGTCDFQVWNPALNGGEGGWEVPYGAGYADRPFVIEFIDNGTGSKGKNAPPPDEFGFSINFVGSIADPSFARGTLNGGNIDVKSSGGTTTTSDGGGTTGGGGKGKNR